MTNKHWERQRDSIVGTSKRHVNILILRDPFNLLASRIRSGLYDNRYIWGEKVVTNRMAMRIWKQHAREVLGQRRRLQPPRVYILYNEWVNSHDYRRSVLQQIGLPMMVNDVQRVPQVADGSSFDGVAVDGRPDRMAVHERWRSYMDDSHFINYFDEQVIELSARIFGDLSVAQAIARKQAFNA